MSKLHNFHDALVVEHGVGTLIARDNLTIEFDGHTLGAESVRFEIIGDADRRLERDLLSVDLHNILSDSKKGCTKRTVP